MSNHWHAVLTDPGAKLPKFFEQLHRLVGKAMNVAMGRRENFWATEPSCAVRLVDRADILAKIAYTLANPVAAGLVAKGRHWPGIWGFGASHDMQIARPKYYFDAEGTMPKMARLHLSRPPGFDDLSDSELYAEVEEQLADLERSEADARQAEGRRVLGREGVLRQSERDTPQTVAQRGGLRPQVAAASKWHRIEALGRLKDFIDAYKEALAEWKKGLRDVLFPAGTYAMRLFHSAACLEC
jgi:hypothetical protein